MSEHAGRRVRAGGRPGRARRGLVTLGVVTTVALLGACSDDGGGSSIAAEKTTTTAGETTTTMDRPKGPAADVSTELTGGKGRLHRHGHARRHGQGRLPGARVRRRRQRDVLPGGR